MYYHMAILINRGTLRYIPIIKIILYRGVYIGVLQVIEAAKRTAGSYGELRRKQNGE